MKIAASIISAFVAGSIISANAFVAPHKAQSVAFSSKSTTTSTSVSTSSSALKTMADDYDIPCEDDCALESYPKLPDTVHPGVNTGQAMLDLLQHAKDQGKLLLYTHTLCHFLVFVVLCSTLKIVVH